MADMLEDGVAWLTGQLKAAAGRPVTYQRGSDTAAVTATIGRSQFQSQNQSGVMEVWESRDYLIPRADLPFGDPRRGDLILEQSNGELFTYEVGAPRGIPVVHYDAFRYIARVHATLTEGAATLLTTEDGLTLVTEAGDPLAV